MLSKENIEKFVVEIVYIKRNIERPVVYIERNIERAVVYIERNIGRPVVYSERNIERAVVYIERNIERPVVYICSNINPPLFHWNPPILHGFHPGNLKRFYNLILNIVILNMVRWSKQLMIYAKYKK